MMNYANLLIILLGFANYSLFSAHVVFDLGGVVFESDRFAIMSKLNENWDLAWYMLKDRKSPTALKNSLFRVMHAIKPLPSDAPWISDGDNTNMPQRMRDFLAGAVAPHELLKELEDALEKIDTVTMSAVEKILLKRLAQLIFSSEEFVRSRVMVQKAFDFARDCKKQGHRLYIISNWDAQSFDILQKQYADFFALFDGIIISGKVNCIKPDRQIFDLFINTFNIDPAQTVFIDDNAENIQAAALCGIKGILCKKAFSFWSMASMPDFDCVRAQFDNIVSAMPAPRTAYYYLPLGKR